MRYLEKHPMLMILVGVIGISLSSIFVRYSQAPSAVTAAWRLCWTVLLLTPALFSRKASRSELCRLRPRQLLLSAASGIFLALHFFTWFESLARTSIASSTSIVATEVVWVALGFCLVLKGRLSLRAMAAIAAALLGSLLIAWSDSGTQAHLEGDLLALLAALSVAVYTLIGRIVRNDVSTTVYTYIVYSVCGLILVLLSLIQGQSLFGYGLSAPLVGLLLALFSTILGHSVFSWCLKYFSPAFVSASKLCEPVAAAILAAILFAEIPSVLQILGGILILGGVLYYSHLETRARSHAA